MWCGDKIIFWSLRRARLSEGMSDGAVRAKDSLHLARVGALVGDNNGVL